MTERWRCPICHAQTPATKTVAVTEPPTCGLTHPDWEMELVSVPEAETEIGGATEKSGDGW